jgi:S-DNA-T family DNA segregation ATPase FtsK/SpoIIIE
MLSAIKTKGNLNMQSVKLSKIIDKMEENGIISKLDEGKQREVLVSEYNFEDIENDEIESKEEEIDQQPITPFAFETNEEEYKEATALVIQTQKASPSQLQRKMRIGYVKAQMYLDKMEEDGIVSPVMKGGQRIVLISGQEYQK